MSLVKYGSSLWPMMMDDSETTHKRRKLVKTYQNMLLRKRTVVTKVYRKTCKLKGNAERERESDKSQHRYV